MVSEGSLVPNSKEGREYVDVRGSPLIALLGRSSNWKIKSDQDVKLALIIGLCKSKIL